MKLQIILLNFREKPPELLSHPGRRPDPADADPDAHGTCDAESDKVVGLESGADDYLTKPFGVRELMARVGAITRRHRRMESAVAPATDRVVSRDITLNLDKREAQVRGQPIELTRQEFDLLHQLASRPGIVYSRAALLQNVWSDDSFVTERTVDTVISRLRRKVERDPQDPELIRTAWGVGYKFADVE